MFLFQISQPKLLPNLFLLPVLDIPQQGLLPFICLVKLLFVRSTVSCIFLKLLLILFVFDIQQPRLVLAHNIACKRFLIFLIKTVLNPPKPIHSFSAGTDLRDQPDNRVIQPLLPVQKLLLLLCLLLIRLLIFIYQSCKFGGKLFIMPAERISKRPALWL